MIKPSDNAKFPNEIWKQIKNRNIINVQVISNIFRHTVSFKIFKCNRFQQVR
jgi:hypothetical protein